jgi:hypothetical protein
MIAGEPDGGMLGPVVGHWALNGKYTVVEIGDVEEERSFDAARFQPTCTYSRMNACRGWI